METGERSKGNKPGINTLSCYAKLLFFKGENINFHQYIQKVRNQPFNIETRLIFVNHIYTA